MARAQSAGTTVFSTPQYYAGLDAQRLVPPLEKPAYCITIDLDQAICDRGALRTFTESTSMCPYYAAAAVAGGAAATAVYAYFSRDPAVTQSLKMYLPSFIAGGVATSFLGDFVYQACRDSRGNVLNETMAACKVDAEVKKVECAKFP
jgi:hypothetical protein